MADWYVRFIDRASNNYVGTYSLMNPTATIRNSDVGEFSGELALAQNKRGSETRVITRDEFAPYRTNFELWRQSVGTGVLVMDGMLTSINLNKDRDTVLIAGKDWKHYLQRRIYPFSPEEYIEYDESNPASWRHWPKKWPTGVIGDRDPVPVEEIIRDILLSMRTGVPIDSRSPDSLRTAGPVHGMPHLVWNLPVTQIATKQVIYPGDQTTIFDHIQRFSEMEPGFEWDILPNPGGGPGEFKMWSPKRYLNEIPPAMWIRHTALMSEADGAVIEFDWTNEGPDGTYLIGLGSSEGVKVGRVWEDAQTTEKFGRLDLVYDYGEMQHTDSILQKLKDQNDLWPQKKLSLTLLNPEFSTPNFYTAGRPRALIGNYIRVTHDFPPLHRVDAYFQINALDWNIDSSTNESVTLELMMVYEPATGASGGLLDVA